MAIAQSKEQFANLQVVGKALLHSERLYRDKPLCPTDKRIQEDGRVLLFHFSRHVNLRERYSTGSPRGTFAAVRASPCFTSFLINWRRMFSFKFLFPKILNVAVLRITNGDPTPSLELTRR